ncbi:MAG: arsenate reductase ArsC [Candidatus Micrarchaeia archaeon]
MKKFVLFVCVGNSGRSQMAEAFFNAKAPVGFFAISAGTKPEKEVNPIVVEVMKEKGIDISSNRPKKVEEWMFRDAFKIIIMGCGDDSCPALFLKKVEDWHLDDPKGKPIEEVRKIRDIIESKVDELIRSLM